MSTETTDRSNSETTETSSSDKALDEQFASFAGRSTGPPVRGSEPVNRAMIRHWVEAMDDYNPVYLDDDAAKDAGFPGVIAPPTMLQSWIMWGLRRHMKVNAARERPSEPGTGNVQDQVMRLLDANGYTSVVATNCEQHYERPLVLGDEVSVTSVVESVSPEKTTALGVGRFLTTRMDYTDATGAPVATMRFRILKFRPRLVTAPAESPPAETAPAETAPRPRRPRPSLTQDNAFFFKGAREGKLLIQRCSECGTLRHPPRPACPNCRSFRWDALQASGRGTIYSFVVNHYPQVPAFDYPLIVALIELEEGTRLVANVSHMTPETVAIGMPVIAEFETFDD
ncbi:MAG TPA: bifunctional MaoC family dehydratase N-terminal/OB-fold nucleic acid binding domain-containing protein, partial [Acidimicrobiales bacterium]|nr:bifunctional MaoC family dehydratase N-terminal/OB-fold nucleic acid binding domain-containing protein [Acidimicrobiales bacterium]